MARLTPASTEDERHAVRGRVKKLRYAVESVADLYGKPAAALLRTLRGLQNQLGKEHDAHLTRQRLRALSDRPREGFGPSTLFLLGQMAERHGPASRRERSAVLAKKARRQLRKRSKNCAAGSKGPRSHHRRPQLAPAFLTLRPGPPLWMHPSPSGGLVLRLSRLARLHCHSMVEREAEGPWIKLRRRKVVQWGLAYAAGAWVLLQVVGFAADAFAWPVIIKQLALLALTVGFPVALTLAWFHGEQGQQRVTGPELVVLTALLLTRWGPALDLRASQRDRPPPPPQSRHHPRRSPTHALR